MTLNIDPMARVPKQSDVKQPGANNPGGGDQQGQAPIVIESGADRVRGAEEWHERSANVAS